MKNSGWQKKSDFLDTASSKEKKPHELKNIYIFIMWMAGFKEEQASYEELSWWRVGSFKLKKKHNSKPPQKNKNNNNNNNNKQKGNSCRTLGWPTRSQPTLKRKKKTKNQPKKQLCFKIVLSFLFCFFLKKGNRRWQAGLWL